MDLADPQVWRGMLEGMAEAVVLVDTAGIVRYWNPAAERLFGYARDEAQGALLDDLIVPERFRAAHDTGFARAIASGELRVAGRVMRTRANHPDGRKLYVDFTFALLKAADGSVQGVYAVARDATEAQLKEMAARAAPSAG
jgi:PAS domain S-box-containing protein